MLKHYLAFTARTYARSFQYVRPHITKLVIAGLLSLVLSVTSGLATYSFLPVFNIVFQHGDEAAARSALVTDTQRNFDPSYVQQRIQSLVQDVFRSIAGQGPLTYQLVRLVGFIAVISLVSISLQLIVGYIFITIQARGVEALRIDVFTHVTQLPLSFFTKTRAGELISRIQNDITGTIVMVTNSLSGVVQNFFLASMYLAILIWLNARLVAVMIPVLALAGGGAFLVGHLSRQHQKKILALQANITAAVHELLGGIKVIKAFTAEKFEQRRWGQSVAVWRSFEIANAALKAFPLHLKEAIAILISCTVLIVGGREILRGEFTVAGLLVFFIVLLRFQVPLGSLMRIWVDVQNGMGYAIRTYELLDQAQEPRTGTKHPAPIQHHLAFEQVSFNYGFEPVLQDISLKLHRGTTTALVGASGSGKSSLADLTLRLYDPSSGRITLDGIDIREYDTTHYRSLFSVVTQETFLFHATIYDNIVYSLPNTPRQAAVEAAAKTAHAHQFIQELPDGYQTVIGDRGVRLSGGQRQRLAIARAILRDAPLLILDEATSSLDTEAERQVQDALHKLMRQRTTLVIAHRLSTIVNADSIAVLHQGKIAEYGTHQQLRAADGIYCHLWSLQAL